VSLTIGLTRESHPDEKRVALTPATVSELKKAGFEVVVEASAGVRADISDEDFVGAGARVEASRDGVVNAADIICSVSALGANPENKDEALDVLKKGKVLVASCAPLDDTDAMKSAAETGGTLFALELVPRITRAQSMDVLSSMATLAGYKAVLVAASNLPRIFPMMMTAAGTIPPARVFVLGAGVAGLQAMATAKRLGAVVEGYDIRPVVKDQVESVGAKFVELDLETEGAEDAGGYAKAQGEDFLVKQRALLKEVVSRSDVVITTAAIPGRPSPELVTEEMVQAMKAGSVIIDLAAARGGNCRLTEPDKDVVKHGVKISGPLNLPSTVPFDASRMFGKNVVTLLKLAYGDQELTLDMDDEVIDGTLGAYAGEVHNARLRSIMGLPERAAKEEEEAPEEPAVEEAE
jgi:NAD(P) transhydrogenase subunit alpha